MAILIIILTERMYRRPASIQDGKRSQAPGDACTVLKRLFCDNFVIFRFDNFWQVKQEFTSTIVKNKKK